MNDLNNVLQNLNANYLKITANIQFPFYFSDEMCGEGGYTFNYICDGDQDIFEIIGLPRETKRTVVTK